MEGDKEMTREEMLNKLHSIKFGAQPTVYTMDMGVQYEYCTGEGYGENLGEMGDWPVYKLEGLKPEQLNAIKTKVKDQTLSLDDIEDTPFFLFWHNIFDIPRIKPAPPLSDFFENINSIDCLKDETIYVLCDSGQWEPTASFFKSYEDIEQAFIEQYSYDIEKWEELDDEELNLWIERFDELEGLCFNNLQED